MTWRRSAASWRDVSDCRGATTGPQVAVAVARAGNRTQYFAAMPERRRQVFSGPDQSGREGLKSISFSAKRSAYSDMPSFSSQSAICCIAAFPASCGAFNSHVDFAAERPEVDWFGQQRLSTVLQSFAFRLRVAIGGDHDDRERPVAMLWPWAGVQDRSSPAC